MIDFLRIVLIGILAGYLFGWAAKKVVKFVILATIAIVGLVAYLLLEGIAKTEWLSYVPLDSIEFPELGSATPLIKLFVAHLPFSIAFLIGLFLNLKGRRRHMAKVKPEK